MKHIVSILFFSFICSLSFAQNNALYPENNVLKIMYGGYHTDHHLFIIENKISCSMNVKIDKNGSFTYRDLAPSDTIQEKVFSAMIDAPKVRVKKENGAECIPQPDNGWVEGNTLNSVLPIRFIEFGISNQSKSNALIYFSAEEDEQIKFYRIMGSKDGRNFKQIGVIPASGTKSIKMYSFNFSCLNF